MLAQLADQIIEKSNQAIELYYRLVLIVAPGGAGKTISLQEVHRKTGAPLINVNLELSERMLDLTERQRALQLPDLLRGIVEEKDSENILLDNIEVVFDVDLKQDPLRLLKRLSRDKTIVAAWNGKVENGALTYAEPTHPEYRRYTTDDFLFVSPKSNE